MSDKFKDIAAPAGSLADVMHELKVINAPKGIDRIRNVLAMRMNQYSNINLTPSEVRNIATSFANIETGSSTNLVVICSKKGCLYKGRCALFVADKAPEGKECLHENKVLMDAMDRYIESLEIETDNYAEMVMVNQLVEYELIEFRCNTILSYDHQNMKMEIVVGVDDNGQLVTKEDISHALQIKLQIFKNKMVLLQELTATRKEIYKKQAALKEGKDGPTKVISGMKAQLEKMKRDAVNAEEVHYELNALADDDLINE
jgi:hypothetical protein